MSEWMRGWCPVQKREDQGFLTVTRNLGESVRIGDDVEVIVSAVRGRSVKLTIVAKKDMPVTRPEYRRRDGVEPR